MKAEDIQKLREINQSTYVLISKDIKNILDLDNTARVKIVIEKIE